MAFMMTMDGLSSSFGAFFAGATAALISIPIIYQSSSLLVLLVVPLIFFL
jgi:hypothetical protein